MSEATHEMGAQDPVDIIEGILSASEETPEEVTEEVTEESVETETEEEVVETESEEEETEVEPEGDTEEEITLEASQLAEYLGVDADAVDVTEDGELVLKTKIDGKEGRATLAELLKSYQLEGHVNQKSMQLSEDRKAFDAERETQKAQIAQELQQAKQLLEFAQNQTLAEYQNIDWQSLREQNPAEYAAMQQDYNARIQQIGQAMNGVGQQSQQVQQQAFVQRRQKEAQMLLDKLPEWSDENVAQKETADVAKYLIGSGFSQQEVSTVVDHRAVIMARKAMLYDKMTAEGEVKKEVAKKKVKKLPRVAKPGASKDKAQAKAEADKAIRQKVKRSGGHVDDVAAAIFERM